MADEETPKLKRDWEGRHVRLRRTVRNQLGEMPAGAVMVVTRNHSGLHLRSLPCDGCGLRFFVRGVPERDVELLPAVAGA